MSIKREKEGQAAAIRFVKIRFLVVPRASPCFSLPFLLALLLDRVDSIQYVLGTDFLCVCSLDGFGEFEQLISINKPVKF